MFVMVIAEERGDMRNFYTSIIMVGKLKGKELFMRRGRG
jgi:hypothetical protein